MGTLSAHDVARELRQRLPEAGVTKIHKLLYYCQGWHATWTDRPLFSERIEAWPLGPVVAALWANEKDNESSPAFTELAEDELATLDYVVARYGAFARDDLVDMTHEEDPWRAVALVDAPVVEPMPEITVEALKRWFATDSDYVAHDKEVQRLRAREAYGLRPRPLQPDEHDALALALAGVRVHDDRPA